jgi:protein disulfide-isomerase
MSNAAMKPNLFLAAAASILLAAAGSAHAESADSLESILQSAKTANKPVVLEFTGSDWCPPCKMMQAEVFSKDAFKTFADDQVVFVKLDFPRQRAQTDDVKARNRALAEQFEIEGFPTLLVLSPEGTELARQVGFLRGGPEAVIGWIKESAKL